jgi:hypothetical protein
MATITGAARAILDSKGRGALGPTPTNANALPMRRTLTLAAALARKPLAQCRILDLACQEGCYAIEAALAGAEVVGVEAREAHVARARECAVAAGVGTRVRYEIGDVRRIDEDALGRFDIVFLLGILYHLEAADAVETIRRIGGLCDDLLIVDTHFAPAAKATATVAGARYDGARVREHDAGDAAATRLARGQASIDNEFAFYFTKPSLTRLLTGAGFPIVLEALAPLDPTKPDDRATFVALKREIHALEVYPWIRNLGEEEIAAAIRRSMPPAPEGRRARLARLLNRALHPLGFAISQR